MIEPQHNGHLNKKSELVLGVHMKGFYNWASENRKEMKLCKLKMLTPFLPGSFPLPLPVKAWIMILQFLRSFWAEVFFLRERLLKCGVLPLGISGAQERSFLKSSCLNSEMREGYAQYLQW